jgi:hypothetical protein
LSKKEKKNPAWATFLLLVNALIFNKITQSKTKACEAYMSRVIWADFFFAWCCSASERFLAPRRCLQQNEFLNKGITGNFRFGCWRPFNDMQSGQ